MRHDRHPKQLRRNLQQQRLHALTNGFLLNVRHRGGRKSSPPVIWRSTRMSVVLPVVYGCSNMSSHLTSITIRKNWSNVLKRRRKALQRLLKVQDLTPITVSKRISGCDLDGTLFERMSLRHYASSSLSTIGNVFFSLNKFFPVEAFWGFFMLMLHGKNSNKRLSFQLFREKKI